MDKAVSKYIKITGVMQKTGEYELEHDLFRPYDAVTFIDSEGLEIHFHKLCVYKRLDDKFKVGQQATFYILRSWIGGMLVGDLYAVEINGEKFFNPDTAIPQLEEHVFNLSSRAQVPVIIAGLFALLAFFATCIIEVFIFPDTEINFLGWFFMFWVWPLMWTFSVDKEGIAKIKEMKADLAADGFDISGKEPVAAHSSKY
ncbi:MAG TPA: hypothetical protein DCL66_16385 [Gammaproteobacteria bacterium]|nr:hypothetical protein [Gammaproteobacteria bacterium]|tara:strand:- start:575 stop:1174 length:600 start_codon:yes stop_codon:yes gene_type:complete